MQVRRISTAHELLADGAKTLWNLRTNPYMDSMEVTPWQPVSYHKQYPSHAVRR